MKSFFFPIFLFLFLKAHAQLPDGVVRLAGYKDGIAFIHEDHTGDLWLGFGGLGSSLGLRHKNGLWKISNGQVDTLYAKGIFTDILESGNEMLVTADNGLYTFRNDSVQLNKVILHGNCIYKFRDKVWIGTSGLGLFTLNKGGQDQKRIRIGGQYYDSIFSLCAEGDILWIGTSKGLVRYAADTFSFVPVPIIKQESSFAEKMQRCILSVQMDGFGRLWVLNANITDTIPCLYVRHNQKFRPATEVYDHDCALARIIPYRANRLGRSTGGYIQLGSYWGIMEFGEHIQSYGLNLSMLDMKIFLQGTNAASALAYESPGSHQYVYSQAGLLKVDRSVFRNTDYGARLLKPYLFNCATLDINDITATTCNDGILFNQGDIFRKLDEWPAFRAKSLGCADAIFSGGLWIRGIRQDTRDLHIAAQTHRGATSDYMPGPLNVQTLSYDSLLSHQYNRIWIVNRSTIDNFLARRLEPGYQIPQEILEWPGNAPDNCASSMAPYVDIDQNGRYEPGKGDYPRIKGDQMLWWVFNDAVYHSETGGIPLKVQVNASCYAYKDIRLSPQDEDFLVNRSIFFSFQVLNLSPNTYEDLHIGIMSDMDLGSLNDDRIGFDSFENAAFSYNNDNLDEGVEGFGKNPPMVLCKFLNRKAHYMMYYNNDLQVLGNPRSTKDYDAYMRSMYYFGDSLFPIKYVPSPQYPCYSPFSPSFGADYRLLMSNRTGTLAPDSARTIELAYILLHNDVDYRKKDCDKPKQSLRQIQEWHDNNSFPSKPYWPVSVYEVTHNALTLFPNPANSALHIQTQFPLEDVQRIEIFDQQGRLLLGKDLCDDFYSGELQIDISSLPTGFYSIRLSDSQNIYHDKFVKE